MATENDRIDALVQKAIGDLNDQLPPKYGVAVIAFGLSEETEGIRVHGGGAGVSKKLIGSMMVMIGDRWQRGEE